MIRAGRGWKWLAYLNSGVDEILEAILSVLNGRRSFVPPVEW